MCDLLFILEAIFHRIDAKISNCMNSTGYPPHLCITFDKSTIHRETNQAVMVIAVVDGTRVPYLLGAPKVYSREPGSYEISGGQSESLMAQAFSTLKTTLPNVEFSYCVGAVADGQYITDRILNAFSQYSQCPSDDFRFIVWDPSHFLDLSVKKLM